MPDEDGGVVWRAATDSTGLRCFTLGLHRTGTRSMSNLLSSYCSVLQYPIRYRGVGLEECIDGRECDLEFIADALAPALESYDSITDVPIPVLYHQLYSRYPTAKFVLLLRNPFDWLRSIRRHIRQRELWPLERVQYWHYLKWRPSRLAEVDDQQLLRMNALHTAEVIDYFQQAAPDKLGVFELRPESGQAIATFLGVDTDIELTLIP